MKQKIRDLLDDVFYTGLLELKSDKLLNEEREGLIQYLTKINTLQNEKEELELKQTELNLKEAEADLKNKERKHEVVFTIIKCGVELIGIGAPLMFYGKWYHEGLKFEEEGVLSSAVFKGLFGKFKPTR